jgi:hypothetical protein
MATLMLVESHHWISVLVDALAGAAAMVSVLASAAALAMAPAARSSSGRLSFMGWLLS